LDESVVLPSKKLIVGIDPGSTIGVALLDLGGRKVACISFEGGGIAGASRVIERHGTPSLVACDVTPPPDMAVKLASYFSCRLFVPGRQIREEEKRAVASGAGARNNHERDAYCAAVYAFRASANKLRQIDALSDVSFEDKDRLKHLLLKGYRLQDAFLEIASEGKKEPVGIGEKPAARAPVPSLDALQKRVSSLARENANLRLMIERMGEERGALVWRLRLLENGVRQRVLRDAEVRRLGFQVKVLLERRGKRKGGQENRRQTEKQPGQHNKTTERQQQAKNGTGQPAGQARLSQEEAGLNNLGEELDLEKLVAEYRKGRA